MTISRTEIHTAFTLPNLLKAVHDGKGRKIKVTVGMVDMELMRAPMLILATPKFLAEISDRGGEYLVNLYKR